MIILINNNKVSRNLVVISEVGIVVETTIGIVNKIASAS